MMQVNFMHLELCQAARNSLIFTRKKRRANAIGAGPEAQEVENGRLHDGHNDEPPGAAAPRESIREGEEAKDEKTTVHEPHATR